RSAAGEDRAVDGSGAQERGAGERQLLLEVPRVLAAIHPDLAAAALVEPGVAGNLVIDAVEQAGLEGRRAGRRAGAARRETVRTALDQGAQIRRIPVLHRVLELPEADAVQMQEQHPPPRRQRRPGLTP